jgi:hypothetical protein
VDKITIGDYVKHKYLTWQGKLKVVAINFQNYTLHNTSGFPIYYNLADLEPWTETDNVVVNTDPLFCTCSYTDKKIVNSSTQVQGNVEDKDKFKFCRTCKKEAK